MKRPDAPCAMLEALRFAAGFPNAPAKKLRGALDLFMNDWGLDSPGDWKLPESFESMAAIFKTRELPEDWDKLSCPDDDSLVWLIRRFGRVWLQYLTKETADIAEEKSKQSRKSRQTTGAQKIANFGNNHRTFITLAQHAVRFSRGCPFPMESNEAKKKWVVDFGKWLPENKADRFEGMSLEKEPSTDTFRSYQRSLCSRKMDSMIKGLSMRFTMTMPGNNVRRKLRKAEKELLSPARVSTGNWFIIPIWSGHFAKSLPSANGM